MRPPWQFAGVKTTRGNILKDYVVRDRKLQARVDAFLKRLRHIEVPWPQTYYKPLGEGAGELRVDFKNVEHRFYGYFGPGARTFTVFNASSDKKTQQKDINAAKDLARKFKQVPPPVENYDV